MSRASPRSTWPGDGVRPAAPAAGAKSTTTTSSFAPPSGTALALARKVCEATGKDLGESAVFGRQGRPGARPRGQIGIHAVRGGDVVGEHRLYFVGLGERVELAHVAHTRDAFAQGALRAAKFLARCRAGLYSMSDVLAAPTEDV